MLDLVKCFSEEFLLQTSCSVGGFSEEFFLAVLMLIFLRGFSYTPDAIFSEKFLIQSSCCFSLVRFRFHYTPYVMFSEEF